MIVELRMEFLWHLFEYMHMKCGGKYNENWSELTCRRLHDENSW